MTQDLLLDSIQRLAPTNNYSALSRQVADDLLSGQDDERLRTSVTELYSLCSFVTGIDENSNHAADRDEIGTPSGKALAPKDAASCLLDYSRTSKFLRGIHTAIVAARERFPNTTIEILYAGCGPFASLALPLTSRFSPTEIQFTLLDIHKRSLDAAQRVFQAFGLTAFIRDYIQCDAASYKHDAPHDIHIILVEAMQAALEKEPQVAITMNLAPQLCSGGIFIPERIFVDCYLCDLTNEFTLPAYEGDAAYSLLAGVGRDAVRVNLGRVLDVAAGNGGNLLASGGRGAHRGTSPLPKVILEVPNDLDGEFNVMLLTTINVFDSIALGEYESGLTCPRVLHDLGKIRRGMTLEFTYSLGDKPGFNYRSLERDVTGSE